MPDKTIVAKWRAWKKNHPEFPLTVHPCGQWSKKRDGKVYYFGPLEDKVGALIRCHAKNYNKPSEAMQVSSLLAEHLADVDERIAAGRLSPKTRRDYVPLRPLFATVGLSRLPADEMGPSQFTMLAREIENSGRTLRTQKNIIMAIKAVFNWGRSMGIVKPFECGPRFKAPSLQAVEAEQDAAGKCRFIEATTILAVLEEAFPAMRVAVLLGINCGFYPGDSAEITTDSLFLTHAPPYHTFRRVKTKRQRMAVLWPETCEAIYDYLAGRGRYVVSPSEKRLLLTKKGESFTRNGEARYLIEQFGKLTDRVGKRISGVSLGSLRHTYATVVDSVHDQSMIDLTMGHASSSIQKRVYRQFNLDEFNRLKVLSDAVRVWLFGHRVLRTGGCPAS